MNEIEPILIQSPDAHSKKQQFIYGCLLQENIREIWVCAGTKFGKTLSGTAAQINYAITRPNTKHRWIAPIYSQTRQPKEYFQRILPGKPHTTENKSDNVINLNYINTRIEFWHGQNPTSLEGDGIHSYVIDEAAKQSPQVKSSARTTTTRTKGPMLYISYPFGKNWFYDGCMEAMDHQAWAFKNNQTIEKVFLHARTCDNPYIDKQVIENARKELPWRLFRQYFLSEFLDDGTVFAGFLECIYTDLIDPHGEVKSWFHQNCNHSVVVIGADWAKTIDYSVFTAIDIATKRVVGFIRFHRRAYTEQVRMLSFFAKRFLRVEIIIHDKTGVGEAVDDMMAYINQPYRGITLSNALKSELVMKLITAFEQKDIRIPNWPEMTGELKAYECKTSAIGTVSYNAPSGKHDDIVMSLAIGYYAAILYCDNSLEIKYLDDLQKSAEADKTELEKYYSELIDDEDLF